MGQRARADADWAEKLAAKKRERLQVEGEGVASSARAGRGECMEAAESSRCDPRAGGGGAAAAAAVRERQRQLRPVQVETRGVREEERRAKRERKGMEAEEKRMRRRMEAWSMELPTETRRCLLCIPPPRGRVLPSICRASSPASAVGVALYHANKLGELELPGARRVETAHQPLRLPPHCLRPPHHARARERIARTRSAAERNSPVSRRQAAATVSRR